MKFVKSEAGASHENYLARVVTVTEDNFSPHPHPDVTRLKRCRIGTDTLYNVIVSIDSKPGKYVFFPALSQINSQFLTFANLYRKAEMNADPTAKTGLFEENGRVKSVRLKGTKTVINEETGEKEDIRLAGAVSDGFLIELDVILDFIANNLNISCTSDDIEDDVWFDTIEHNGKSFWLSKKYIIKTPDVRRGGGRDRSAYRQKKLKKFDIVIPEQFRFHYDTILVRKCPFVIQPNDYIHISSKIHGTSFIVSNVLCNKEMTFKDKIVKFFTKKTPTEYNILYASRTVIKNQFIIKDTPYKTGFYNCDVWKCTYDLIKDNLPKGYTVYGEIVGYLPTGGYIQKGYDYGCVPPQEGEEYTHEKHFKVRIYRVTITNIDGDVFELNPLEVQTWCKQHNMVPVTQLYYGRAKDLYPQLDIENHWHEDFWDTMADDKNFYMEMNSPECNNKVPHEGVVIKINDSVPRAFKLKCFSFLNNEAKALDKGEANIEDSQSDFVEQDEQSE